MPKRAGASIIADLVHREFSSMLRLKIPAICKPSPAHFLEGVLIERTSQKLRHYAWVFSSPLWANSSVPKLNYGYRLNKGFALEGDEREIANSLIEEITTSPSVSERLFGSEITPAHFLETSFGNIDLQHDHNSTALLDFSIASLLAGNRRVGENSLHLFLKKIAPTDDKFVEHLLMILDSLKDEDSLYLDMIYALEKDGRKRLGLG